MKVAQAWVLVGALAFLSGISAVSQSTNKKEEPRPEPRQERPRFEPRQEPREEPRQEPRQEPRREERPYQPPRQEERQYQAPRQEQALRQEQPGNENRGFNPAPSPAPTNTFRQTTALRPNEYHYYLGQNHASSRIILPSDTPQFRRARIYNTRPGGRVILPEYFGTHFGSAYSFHFTPAADGNVFRSYNGENYFATNGCTFGVMGAIPTGWNIFVDNLYIDVGDDGNYYLYDSAYPDFTVQLTFVDAVGDDQADYPDSGNPGL
jgi:hypothetical protein